MSPMNAQQSNNGKEVYITIITEKCNVCQTATQGVTLLPLSTWRNFEQRLYSYCYKEIQFTAY